jgi:hypothetical protein
VIEPLAIFGALCLPFFAWFCLWDFKTTRIMYGIRLAHGLGDDVDIRRHNGRWYTIEGDAIRWLTPPKVSS